MIIANTFLLPRCWSLE